VKRRTHTVRVCVDRSLKIRLPWNSLGESQDSEYWYRGVLQLNFLWTLWKKKSSLQGLLSWTFFMYDYCRGLHIWNEKFFFKAEFTIVCSPRLCAGIHCHSCTWKSCFPKSLLGSRDYVNLLEAILNFCQCKIVEDMIVSSNFKKQHLF